MNKMLEVKNLFVYYDNRNILKDINFDVLANEKLCIVGQNGCGKSTLLKALCGIINFQGDILINGNNINSIDKYNKIGIMSQISNIYFGYSVYDTIMMGRYANFKDKLFSLPGIDDKEFVNDCINKLRIRHLKDKLITELSGGELQKVFLARILAQDPNIILLDEPTNHLDLNSQIEFIYNLNEWVSSGNRCIVSVLHDINSVLNFADKILILKDGIIKFLSSIIDFDLNILNDVYSINIVDYMLKSVKRWI